MNKIPTETFHADTNEPEKEKIAPDYEMVDVLPSNKKILSDKDISPSNKNSDEKITPQIPTGTKPHPKKSKSEQDQLFLKNINESLSTCSNFLETNKEFLPPDLEQSKSFLANAMNHKDLLEILRNYSENTDSVISLLTSHRQRHENKNYQIKEKIKSAN